MLDLENVEDLPTYNELATITKAEWECLNCLSVRRPQVGEEWAKQLGKDAVVKAQKRDAIAAKQKQKSNAAAKRLLQPNNESSLPQAIKVAADLPLVQGAINGGEEPLCMQESLLDMEAPLETLIGSEGEGQQSDQGLGRDCDKSENLLR